MRSRFAPVKCITSLNMGWRLTGVIRKAKRGNERVKILARAHSEIDSERLYKAGADVVIIPEFVSAEKIVKKIDHFLHGKGL